MRNELGGPDSNLSLMGAIDVGVTDIKNRIYNGTDLRTVSNALIDTNYLWFTILNSTNSLLSINNVNATGNAGTTSLTNGITLGTYSPSTAQLNGFISEQIIYSGSQSANQTGIQSNINSYYGIY